MQQKSARLYCEHLKYAWQVDGFAVIHLLVVDGPAAGHG